MIKSLQSELLLTVFYIVNVRYSTQKFRVSVYVMLINVMFINCDAWTLLYFVIVSNCIVNCQKESAVAQLNYLLNLLSFRT